MITFQKYVKASSLEEAYTLNQARANRIMGGMLWLREGSAAYNTMIDLSGLGLDKIEEDETQFTIGAMVTLRQLEKHPSLNAYTNNAVARAVSDIVGVQFRNMATVGGSIWGRFGFSDVLTVFLAMDSYVELYKGGIIPLEEFAAMKYDNDLLVNIIVKKQPACFVYDAMRIQRTDFPVIAVAVSKVDGVYKAVIGARPGHARVVYDKKDLLASGLTEESCKAFASYAASAVPFGTNMRGSASYRAHLTRVLTERNLLKLGELS